MYTAAHNGVQSFAIRVEHMCQMQAAAVHSGLPVIILMKY